MVYYVNALFHLPMNELHFLLETQKFARFLCRKKHPRLITLYLPLKCSSLANIQRLDLYELNVGFLCDPMEFLSLCFVETKINLVLMVSILGSQYFVYLSPYKNSYKRRRVIECKAGFINAISKYGMTLNYKLALNHIYSCLVIAPVMVNLRYNRYKKNRIT